MIAAEKLLLEFITRLVYNIEGLPGSLQLYFSQYLVAHFASRVSLSQLQHIENQIASKSFHNLDEIEKAASSFSTNDKIWIVASLLILQSKAEQMDDRVISRKIGKLVGELITLLKLQEATSQIQEEKHTLESELQQFQNRPLLKIPTAIWPLTLDYGLRWLLLLAFSYFGYDKNYLIVFNTFAISALVFFMIYVAGLSNKKFNKQLLEQYGGEQKFQIVYELKASQYTWLAVYLGTSVFISYLLQVPLPFITLLALLLYYFIYLRYFRIGNLKENHLVRQLEKETLVTEGLSADQNDEVIVLLETKLNSFTSRLEAYVLESALFGALSFSGFLQIMATELISFDDLEKFASYIFLTAQAFIHLDWTQCHEGLMGLSTKESLFCLVSVESLFCSIFFLAVIATRLRFSDIVDRVRTAINMAKAYNEKEESLLDEEEITGKKSARLNELTSKVNLQLHHANVIMEEITPVMRYMEYFRNAAIMVFVIILISSSLFITGAMGWIFIGLVMATSVYFNRDSINQTLKSWLLNFRIHFIRLGPWLFLLCVAPYVLAYVLKIFFHWPTYQLFPISAIIISLYTAIWLVLGAHIDERFGEIEMDEARQRRWHFVKNSVAVFIILFGIASTFKMLSFDGANQMLIISLMSLSILMYFVGYYLTKVRWLGILSGGIIAISCVGLVFKVLHFAGANELVLTGMMGLLILTPVIVWKRKLFHQLFLRFYLVALIFSFWYNPWTYRFHTALEVAYANETLHISKIIPVVESNSQWEFWESDEALQQGINLSDWYLNEYGTTFGFNYVHSSMVRNYYGFGLQVLSSHTKDTAILNRALKALRQQNKILKLFNYTTPQSNEAEKFTLEADVLLLMGKKQEAIESIETLVKENLPKTVIDRLKEKLIKIKSV